MPMLLDLDFQTNVRPHPNWTKNKARLKLTGTTWLFPAAPENSRISLSWI